MNLLLSKSMDKNELTGNTLEDIVYKKIYETKTSLPERKNKS